MPPNELVKCINNLRLHQNSLAEKGKCRPVRKEQKVRRRCLRNGLPGCKYVCLSDGKPEALFSSSLGHAFRFTLISFSFKFPQHFISSQVLHCFLYCIIWQIFVEHLLGVNFRCIYVCFFFGLQSVSFSRLESTQVFVFSPLSPLYL